MQEKFKENGRTIIDKRNKFYEAIQDFGIQIENVEIYSLEQGNIDIDMTIPNYEGHGECEKIIAPMLSDILGETILVSSEECATIRMDFYHVTFRSAKAYTVETGVAHAAKDGGLFQVTAIRRLKLDLANMRLPLVMGWAMGKGPILKVRKH